MYPILYLISSITVITVLDIVGSISSRRLDFKYRSLIIPSLLLYILIGFISARQFGFHGAVYVNALTGFYDGTIGFWLSIKLRANGTENDRVRNFLGIKSGLYMVGVGVLCGLVGYYLSLIGL